MTVKEFYELAVAHGKEDAKIFINYECSDSWYDIEEYLEKEKVIFKKNIVEIKLL